MEGLSNVKRNENHEIYISRLTTDNFENSDNVLMEGDYNGRHFAIIRHELGFPDAYIEVKEDDWISKTEIADYDQRYDAYQGYVHGGATFYGKCYWNKEDTRTYLGWDYGHCGDYEASSKLYEDCKKWSYAEILMDIARVWEDLEWMNNDHWEELYALPTERDLE